MTFNTKDLRDGHLPLVERIDIALRRVTNGEGQMRVPVEATDPDIVLHNCRDRITEGVAWVSSTAGDQFYKPVTFSTIIANRDFRTTQGKEDWVWAKEHRYKISGQVERVDAALLRKVADLIGYKPEAKP